MGVGWIGSWLGKIAARVTAVWTEPEQEGEVAPEGETSAVEASSTPVRRAFQPERLAELLKLLRAAASTSSAATAQKKAQTHAETAAAPSDRQLLSSPRLIAGAAPSSPDHSPEQRVAVARAANAQNAAAAPPFSVEFQI